MNEYDRIGQRYSSLVEADPIKVYSQYPSLFRFIGDVEGKRILDMGCGDGTISRRLAENGAKVLAFDIAEKQIVLARNKNVHQNVEYQVNTPSRFVADSLFDDVIAVLVLPYAKDLAGLQDFFDCAFRSLVAGGRFIAITFIPNANIFDRVVFNRRFTKMPDRKIQVEFIDEAHSDSFKAVVMNFTEDEYESSARKAGFSGIEWKNLVVDENPLSDSFWTYFKSENPYKAMICLK